MPWHVVADHAECGEGRFGVVKDDGGELVACHNTRESADQQVAALYASEDGRSHAVGVTRHMPGGHQHNQLAHAGDLTPELLEVTPKNVRVGDLIQAVGDRSSINDKGWHAVAGIGKSGSFYDFRDEDGRLIQRVAPSAKVEIRRPRQASTDSDGKRHRNVGVCTRSFNFQLRSNGRRKGDGRTLEGYAAVYGHPAKIRDLKGDFEETIRAGAFKKSLEQRTPVMQWEHGRDPRVGAVPIAEILDLDDRADGLFVRARLMDDPLVEPIRKAIAAKTVKGMSFRFEVADGGDTWTRNGRTEAREVHDADVHELGPVVFPAYDATSVSVRSLLAAMQPDEIRELVHELAGHLGQAVELDERAETIRTLVEGGLDPKETAAAVMRGDSFADVLAAHDAPTREERDTDITGRPTSGDAGGGDPDSPTRSGERSTLSDPRIRDRMLTALGVHRG